MQTIFDKKKTGGLAVFIAVVTLLAGGFMAFSFVKEEPKTDNAPIEETDELPEVNVAATPQTGKPAPEFKANDIKLDKEITLSRFSKMDVLLYFWDPYDEKQSARIERLIELQKELKGKVAIIGIARNTGDAKMEAYIKENKINFPVILSTDEIESAYAASPDNSYCVLIGLDRTIMDTYTGVLNMGALSSKIEKDME